MEGTFMTLAGGHESDEARPGAVRFRPGTLADSESAFSVFSESVMDLGRRQGVMAISGGHDPAVLENLWPARRPMFEHLTRTAEHFWVAEQDGQVIGYARSILRTGVRELTEFFVRPGAQSTGVGRALLSRAFPAEGASHRVLVGTSDERALALYLRSGVYPRCPAYQLVGRPAAIEVATDLRIEPVSETRQTLAALAEIDAHLLGFRRDIDHAFLLADRQGYLYRRSGQPVGYGYTGPRNGPFALLDERDFPAVLAQAESAAAAAGREFGVELPLINQAAVSWLLERKFRLEPFVDFIFTDGPLGRFENYIFTSPPFFL